MLNCTKGKWNKEGNKIKVFGKGTVAICPSPTNAEGVLEFIANAHLIAAAVNACQEVNPDNPMAVAESIKDMYEALKELLGVVALYGLPSEAKIRRAEKVIAKVEEK